MRTPSLFASTAIAGLALTLCIAPPASMAQQAPEPAPPAAVSAPADKARDAATGSEHDQKAKESQQTPAGKMGTEEPSSRTDINPDWQGPPFINGAWAVAGTVPDMQTVPAKFSSHNATLDDFPTMAFPLPIDKAQWQRLAEAAKSADAPIASVALAPAQLVPLDVAMNPLPPELVAANPILGGLKYARTKDGVLLVQPRNRIVVGIMTE